MKSTDAPSPTGGAPAVGNILGLGLLLRDRMVVLSLERRGLEPGVRVRDLEAEIRHVPFPIVGALSAARFRHHRSRLLRATLQFDVRALMPRIAERLRGFHVEVLDATVGDVELELRDETRSVTNLASDEALSSNGIRTDLVDGTGVDDTSPAHVVIELVPRHGGVLHLLVPIAFVPRGRRVEIHPLGATFVGRPPGAPRETAASVWRVIVEQLRPEAHVRDGIVAFAPANATLVRPFASAGWRAPELAEVHVESITVERRSVHVELRRTSSVLGSERADAWPSRGPRRDAVHDDDFDADREGMATSATLQAVAAVHDAVDRGDREAALRRLEAITRTASTRSMLRLAFVRWRADLGQFHDRAASIAALREWLELRPRDLVARRRLVALLAALGEANALAQLLLAERRELDGEGPRDAIDLALAALLAGPMGDPGAALSILVPMTARLRRVPERRSELEAALVGLAEARAVDALRSRAAGASSVGTSASSKLPHVQAALDEACVLVEDAERRMDVRLRVARRLISVGGDAAALRIIGQALAEVRPLRDEADVERARRSAHAELLELAVDAASRLGQLDVAAEFSRHRLAIAGARDRGTWRRRRISLLERVGGDDTLRDRLVLVEEALHDEPDAIDLLRAAFELAEQCGDEVSALRHGWSLLDRLDDERDDVVDVRLTMARVLLATRDEHAAWDMLRPLLARDDVSGERLLATLELALVLAPAFDRARILDRLIAVAKGPRLGRALVERADLAITPAQRWRDLEQALAVGAEPQAVLTRMEGSLDPEDATALAMVAELAHEHQVPTVELRVLVRLGLRHARFQRWADAIPTLERAFELAPTRGDVGVALGEAYVEHGRHHEGLARLQPFLDPENAARAGASASGVALRMARAALALGDDLNAADLLARARAGLTRAELSSSTLAEDLFDVLYRLGRSDDAGGLARDMAAHAEGHARATWLLRSAEFERDEARLQALFEAATLAPHDPEILDALEAELRARGRWQDLDALFESRLARVVEPTARAELLERWVFGRDPTTIPAQSLAHVVDACEELLAFRPSDASLELHLAELLERSGDVDAANVHRLRALASLPVDDPDAARAAFVLATHALRIGDVDAAHRHAARARAGGIRDVAMASLDADVARSRGDGEALKSSLVELLELTTPGLGEPRGATAEDGWTIERDLWSGELATLAESLGDLDVAARWLGERCESTRLDRRERERRFETWIDFTRRHDRVHDERAALARRRDLLGEAWDPAEFSREIMRLAGPLDRFEEALARVTTRILEQPDDEELHRLLHEITKDPTRLPRRVATLEAMVGVIQGRRRPTSASITAADGTPTESDEARTNDTPRETIAIRSLIDGLERTASELDADEAVRCLELAWSIAAPVDRVTLLAEALARRPNDERVAAALLSTTAELRREPSTPPWSNAVVGQSFAIVDGITRSRAMDADARTAARMALVGMLPDDVAIEMLLALAGRASFGSIERAHFQDALCGRGRWRDVLELLRADLKSEGTSRPALAQVRAIAESTERVGDLETARTAWAILVESLPVDAIDERLQAVRATRRLGVEPPAASALTLARDLLARNDIDAAVELATPHAAVLANDATPQGAASAAIDWDDTRLLQALCAAHLQGAVPRKHVAAVVSTLATRAATNEALASACEALAGDDRDAPIALVRGWTESLSPGPLRARHAARLLELGRNANAPRAVAQAIEALESDGAAGVRFAAELVESAAFVDHRTWLARSLGLVDDEIARLESALLSTPHREMAWRGLTSLREGDLDAAVLGLIRRARALDTETRAVFESTGVDPGGASPMPGMVLDALLFVREVVPQRSLSPTVRMQLLEASLDHGASPGSKLADLDDLIVDAEVALLPSLRGLASRMEAGPTVVAATSDASGLGTENASGLGTDVATTGNESRWIHALTRRVLARVDVDEAGWRELIHGAACLAERSWWQLFDAAALVRPNEDLLALTEHRLDEVTRTGRSETAITQANEANEADEANEANEALVLRYLSLQPSADLVVELPRMSAGPSEWYARLGDDARTTLAAATERAVQWLPSSWLARDVRRGFAAGLLTALEHEGDESAAEAARAALERVLHEDVAFADLSGDVVRGVAYQITLIDARPGDAAVLRDALHWYRSHGEPAALRTVLLDGLDAASTHATDDADAADLDLARIELLLADTPDSARIREALGAFLARYGTTPSKDFADVLRRVDAIDQDAVLVALSDALPVAEADHRGAVAAALLRRALLQRDPAALQRALEAGVPLESPEERAETVRLAMGDASLRESLRWRILQFLRRDTSEDLLRRSIFELVFLTDAVGASGLDYDGVPQPRLVLSTGEDEGLASRLSSELSPWLGDVHAQAVAPRRAALASVMIEVLLEARALDVGLVAACTVAISAASESSASSPWLSWSTAIKNWLGERFLDELVRSSAHEVARRFAEHMASVVPADERASWLGRAAALTADERAALATIDAALRVNPGDERLLRMQEVALERSLATHRDESERRRLRARLAQLRPHDTVLAAKVVDDLLVEGRDDDALRLATTLRESLSRGARDPSTIDGRWYERRADDSMLDVTALLDVSSTIARIQVGRGAPREAFSVLAPFFPSRPASEPGDSPSDTTTVGPAAPTRVPPGVANLALSVARQLGDPDALIRVLATLVATSSGPSALPLRDELAAALELASRPLDSAREWLACARSSPPAGDDRRRRALRAFQLTHGTTDTATRDAAEEELALEAALLLLETGPGDIDAEHVTAIATCLWAHDRGAPAIAFVDDALRARPDDETLLTAQRELCAVMSRPIDWYQALHGAVVAAGAGARHDGLALELAYVGVELEDPNRTLDALESITGPLESSPEVLDLRDWAMRRLGRGDDEVQAILAGWPRDGADSSTTSETLPDAQRDGAEPSLVQGLRRASRIVDGDRLALVVRVMDHALTRSEAVSRRMRVIFVRWLTSEDPSDFVATDARVAAVLASLRRIITDDVAALSELRDAILTTAGDAEADDLPSFLEIAARHDGLASSTSTTLGDTLLASALTQFPDSQSVVDAFLATLNPHDEDRGMTRGASESATSPSEGEPIRTAAAQPISVTAAAVDDALARILPSVGLRPRLTARVWIAVSSRLDRREGSALLLRRAVAWAADEPDAHDALVDALSERSAWPELIAALDGLASTPAITTARRVAAYKRLAHVRLEVLGDDDGVVRELESALALAPEDPDLLLPLLDHHYAKRDLGPALDLSRRVMAHVPMGDAAFVALGLRTADAALAWGDPKLAESVLESILTRCPGERRVQSRLGELRNETSSPEHRVRMLAAVASRQTGVARRDALEERARLLVSPLGRIDEALTELELLLADGGLRPELHDLLASLYTQRARWSELADLLEREYPRKQGIERANILRRLAGVYGDRLYDLPRAEQALRLALENLNSEHLVSDAAGHPLRDELLIDMVRVLELQGRYGELATTLEHELRDELSGDDDGALESQIPESRIRLLEQLGRVLRDYVEDESRTARIYERLRRLDRLPDDGLAVLARWYRAERRFDDLVHILELRSSALAASGDLERKAEIDRRIGDLLEGPLRRPRDAARWYLDAYLASPEENAGAGAKARVLLAGTDAIENVRKLLLQRIEELPPRARPAAHTLLADLLAPQESFEGEAEQHYRTALDGDPDAGAASEGLGRLLARQGRLEAAADPLLRAATSDRLSPERAADLAAIAARVLFELGKVAEAERVLKYAIGRAPDAQRALLELARLYSRTRRADAEADILDRLSDLPLSSMLRAEVAYRRAMLLEADFELSPSGVAGEQAKAWLLEAVGADAMHAQARQTLLGLATARNEWSIVAHMHFLAIRELPPGPSRALAHLDLAEVYLDRLGDAESALRNLGAALTSPTGDLVAERRAYALAMRFPDAVRASAHLGRIAVDDADLQPGRRVKLLLLAAELALRGDDPSAADPLVQRALAMDGATEEDREAARRLQASLSREDVELRRQRNALLKLLEAEEHPGERLHILVRLREIGSALGDTDLVTSVTGDLHVLAEAMFDQDGEREAAFLALRDLLGERGDYPRLVELHERMAEASADDVDAARLLVEAARVAWSGLRDPARATRLVLRALLAAPDLMEAAALLSELGRSDDATLDALVVDELERIPTNRLGEDLIVRLAKAALRRDREDLAESTLRRALGSTPPDRRGPLLDALDELLARRGDVEARMDVLQQRIRHARVHARARVPDIAFELARAQKASGAIDAARHTVSEALALAPGHVELAHLEASLLEAAEDWTGLAAALERLAELSTADDERAAWITRAAKVHLAHPAPGEVGLERVRGLLDRARKTSIHAREARALLIPISFGAGDWPLVLELTVELRAVHGDDEEALIFGALVEALVAGRRTVARAVGSRHERQVRMRMMWPAAARLLDVVAIEGPLERLDVLLGAIGALVGSTEDALAELSTFAAASPPRAGTALALARLHEAIGRSEMARYWYQLVAFLAPLGPIPVLADRLAPPDIPGDPLHVEGWTPLGWRGPLRETLIELRGSFAGMRLDGGSSRPPRSAEELELLRYCDVVVQRWRGPLELDLTIALTDDPVHAGIGARNLLPPTLVLSREFAELPRGEQVFRLAVQSIALASGLGVAVDTHPVDLVDLLDALALLCGVELTPPNPTAVSILDALAARGVRPTSLTPELRRALRDELGHWRSTPTALAQLVATIRRAFLAVALRISGRLDGALATLARDLGLVDEMGRVDVGQTLASDDAQWLLRELGLLA